MNAAAPRERVFLFLQGPHGPFFNRLGKMLRLAGAQVWRVGFNAGDRAFWFHPRSYIPFRGTADTWKDTFVALLADKGVTDIVLYGDTRPIHAQAVAEAKARGLTVHVFEEGYMRPYWVTYERGGSNGNSRLMDMSIEQMQAALANSDMEAPLPPVIGVICASTCSMVRSITGLCCSGTATTVTFARIGACRSPRSSSCTSSGCC
ncbi:hypothetical protein Sulfitobl28_24910 [Sulfitobacter pontiacus]|nr:hypothetical protein Sulfitobl28_24910 [Sulfitobacter pontiacus]